jgi:hypothetical protein
VPRKKTLRRFDPSGVVSQIVVDEEAKHVAREVANYALLARSDIETKLVERYANVEHCWRHLQELLSATAEHERVIIRGLLFRDLYHILELYLAYVRTVQPERAAAPLTPGAVPTEAEGKFAEWLFDLSGKEE